MQAEKNRVKSEDKEYTRKSGKTEEKLRKEVQEGLRQSRYEV